MKANNLETKFDKWHEQMDIDPNADYIWYNYIKTELLKMDLEGKVILEIGCGRGDFANWFVKNIKVTDFQYIAADFSKEAVHKAQRYFKNKSSKVKFIIDNIQGLKFDSNSFDIVISCETIEHVPHPEKAIKELFRVLKKEGQLLLTTPNYLGFFGLYRIYLRLTGRKWTEAGQPLNRFVMIPRTLYWIKKAGFSNINFDSDIISTPFFGKKVKHLSVKYPRWFFKWFGLQSYFSAYK